MAAKAVVTSYNYDSTAIRPALRPLHDLYYDSNCVDCCTAA